MHYKIILIVVDNNIYERIILFGDIISVDPPDFCILD